jgi:hypothetical protein
MISEVLFDHLHQTYSPPLKFSTDGIIASLFCCSDYLVVNHQPLTPATIKSIKNAIVRYFENQEAATEIETSALFALLDVTGPSIIKQNFISTRFQVPKSPWWCCC